MSGAFFYFQTLHYRGFLKMFPLIPKDLIIELNRRFPNQSPQNGETHTDLVWRGGQRSVIEFLNNMFEEQEASRLGE